MVSTASLWAGLSPSKTSIPRIIALCREEAQSSLLRNAMKKTVVNPKYLSGKEWCKLLDDFISDEIVQIDEEFANDSPSSWPDFVKGYISRECGLEIGYRLRIRHKQTHDLRIITSCAYTEFASHNVYLPPSSYTQTSATLKATDDKGCLMFVVIPETVKDIQRVSFGVIPSIVRLEVLNKRLGIGREASEHWQYFHVEPFLFNADRKGKLTTRLLTTDLPQAPNKIIKCRPEIVDGVSNKEPKPNRRLPVSLKTVAHEVARSLRVYLANHTVRVCLEEGISFTYELLYVLPRPLDPRMGEFHVISHTPQIL